MTKTQRRLIQHMEEQREGHACCLVTKAHSVLLLYCSAAEIVQMSVIPTPCPDTGLSKHSDPMFLHFCPLNQNLACVGMGGVGGGG